MHKVGRLARVAQVGRAPTAAEADGALNDASRSSLRYHVSNRTLIRRRVH
jgi:hypothetical protein